MDIYANMALLLQGLGENIGLDISSPELNDNYFCLAVDTNRVLNLLLNPATQSCVFHMEFRKNTVFSSGSSEERIARLAFLLGANVMLIGANGAAIGYDADTDTASMSMRYDIPDEITEHAQELFISNLTTFLDTFNRWAEHIESASDSTGNSTKVFQMDFLKV